MSLIKLDNVQKEYQMGEDLHLVLQGVSLEVREGEMLSIMGASGSGKSTIMNIIGLLDKPTRGECSIKGRSIKEISDNEMAGIRNRSIGFVFQQFYLLSKFSAERNVALPLMYRGFSASDAYDRAIETLGKVGMSDKLRHKPNELSGGQQQRVAIARALVGNPDIVLADEPTGALDSVTGNDVMDLFVQLNREEQKTIVVVTHDAAISAKCQRVLHISDGLVVDETYN